MRCWPIMLLAGCAAPDPSDTAPPRPTTWASLLVDQVPGGMLLSAWEDPSGDLVMAGGNLAGNSGRLARWDGTTLCVQDNVTNQPLWWIDGDGDQWYASGAHGAVLHSSAGALSRVDVPTDATLFGVYYDGTNVWAAGGNTTTVTGEIWTMKPGGTWEVVAQELPGMIFKAWNGWFIGDGVAYFWDGTQLVDRSPPAGERLLTIHGANADDAWVVGGLTGPVMLRWSNGAWSSVPTDPCLHAQLSGVWVDTSGDVWVAGHNGTAAMFDGNVWTCDLPPITAEHFHGVIGHQDKVMWMGGNLLSTADSYATLATSPPMRAQPEVSQCE